MTPGELSTIATIINILSGFSGWPFGMVVFIVVIGPWISAFSLVYLQSRRFEKVVVMYKNNVALVEDYSRLAKDLHDVVIMNTQAMTRLVDRIDKEAGR